MQPAQNGSGRDTMAAWKMMVMRPLADPIRRWIMSPHFADPFRDSQNLARLARPAGLEPATTGSEDPCSILLSYGRATSSRRSSACHTAASGAGSASGDVFADVRCQDTMNQRLVSHVAAPRFRPKALQHLRIEANGDEPPRACPNGRTPDASHGAELCVRRLRNVREINRSRGRGTPRAPCGSPVVR